MRSSMSIATVCLVIFLGACGGEEAEPVSTPTLVGVPQPSAGSEGIPAETSPSTPDPTGATEHGSESAVIATPSTDAKPGTADTTPAQTTDSGQLAYFLQRQSQDRLWVEPVEFTYDADVVGGGVAREALTRLLAAPDEGGLTNIVPDGTTLLDVTIDNRVLRVDLSEEVTDNPGARADAEQLLQQMLAHTGAQFETVDRVQVLVAGQEVDSLWGHVDWSQPFEPDLLALSPIVIDQADPSAGTIRLAGTANVFEATFDLTLTDDTGTVIKDTFVTASCGSGCRGEWALGFDGLQPGNYTVTAREQNPSAGEGFAPFEVTVDVEVA